MRYFKHLKTDHALGLTKMGILRLGTLYEYREIENNELVDCDEGRITTSYVFNGKESFTVESLKTARPEIQRIIIPPKEPAIDPNAKMTISNLDFRMPVNVTDCYIYCLSHSQNKIFEGYDSCVEITNIDLFTQILLEISAPYIRNAAWQAAKINYIGRNHTSGFYPDPTFVKDEKYKKEEEFRIAIASQDSVITHSDGYLDYCAGGEVFLPKILCNQKIIGCVKQIY